MDELSLIVKNDKVFCTSRDVAKNFKKEHKVVLRAIENLEIDYDFRRHNFAPTKYKSKWKEYPEILLTRKWFTILALWFTWKIAMTFKLKLIDQFEKMEEIIRNLSIHKKLPEYNQSRLEGKIVRKNFTDAIQSLKDYTLKVNPLANVEFIFSQYTKVLNKNLFDIEWKYKNIREVCDKSQLDKLKVIEEEIAKIIYDEIDKNTEYKEIYSIVKEKLEIFWSLFWKSKVISTNLLK